jgi:hypothetical protein
MMKKKTLMGEAMEIWGKIKQRESLFVIIIPSGQMWEWEAKQI